MASRKCTKCGGEAIGGKLGQPFHCCGCGRLMKNCRCKDKRGTTAQFRGDRIGLKPVPREESIVEVVNAMARELGI